MSYQSIQELLRSAHAELLSIPTLDTVKESLLKRTELTVHSNDNMIKHTFSSAKHYLNVGISAIECINKAMHRTGKRDQSVKNVLDLPCGYGRVLRSVKSRFPESNIHACELIPDAVEFCANTFHTTGVLSNPDFSKVRVSEKFDLIWCGSLITHLDEKSTKQVLDFFYNNLAPNGICIFTTHGLGSVKALEQQTRKYGLSDQQISDLLKDYAENSFGYISYNSKVNYGISLSTTQKILELAYDTGNWHNAYFEQEGWDNHQDVFAFVKN